MEFWAALSTHRKLWRLYWHSALPSLGQNKLSFLSSTDLDFGDIFWEPAFQRSCFSLDLSSTLAPEGLCSGFSLCLERFPLEQHALSLTTITVCSHVLWLTRPSVAIQYEIATSHCLPAPPVPLTLLYFVFQPFSSPDIVCICLLFTLSPSTKI